MVLAAEADKRGGTKGTTRGAAPPSCTLDWHIWTCCLASCADRAGGHAGGPHMIKRGPAHSCCKLVNAYHKYAMPKMQ